MNGTDFFYFQEHGALFIIIYILLFLTFLAFIFGLLLMKRLNEERLINEQQKTDLIKFKLAVQNVYDIIMISDGSGRILFVNKMFEVTTFFRVGEIVGHNLSEALVEHLPADFLENMLRTVLRENMMFDGETSAKRKNGEEYFLKINISPIFDEYGKIVFCVAIMRDVSKEKEIEQAKSDFVSIVSHQLRTPLTVIKGYVSMLKEAGFGVLSDQQRVILSKVYDSNEHLINLVQDLLNMSRIEAGRIKYDFEEGQLEDIVNNIVEEMTNVAQEKGLYLKYDKPTSPLPKIRVDKEKIRQVIINFIDNSIKYTPQGGLSVSLSATADHVRFEVSDTGLGIKEDEMNNLFNKYSRGSDDSSKTKTIKGTGLGLYVAKMMVEAHKGVIGASSDGENKGAIFYFEIPVIKK